MGAVLLAKPMVQCIIEVRRFIMNNLELDNKKSEDGVKITRYKRKLGKKEIEFANVSRKTADIDSILTLVSKYDTGINRLMIQHCVGLFKRAVLEKLESGSAVNLLGLGTMFINAAFNEDGKPELSVGFTPSDEAMDAVKNLDIVVTDYVSQNPEIEEVVDLKTRTTDGTVCAGKDIKVSGKRLKLVDSKTGMAYLAFAPCSADGMITEPDQAKWVKVIASELSVNKPSELQFYIPDSLPEGTYKIQVNTWYSRSGRNAKVPLRTGEFDKVIRVVKL